MSLSGISISDDIIKTYENKRFERKEGGFILKIEDDQIQIEKVLGAEFESLKDTLPDNEPRYVLYDVPIKNRANLDDLKTVFLMWMPMDAPVRLRMMYSSTKSVINSNFRGITLQIQEDDKSNLDLEYVKKKINKAQGINNF